jgi:hypothetical protein
MDKSNSLQTTLISKGKRMSISRNILFRRLFTLLAVMGMLLLPASNAFAATIEDVTYDFASPLFGLTAAPDGSLLVADA